MPERTMKKWLRDNRGLFLFLLLLGISRTSLADWNHIPSGSMRPTLLEGDMVFVNRIAYDLKAPFSNVILGHFAEPARGDVVVFYSPEDGKRLIKRLVGQPGDVIEMRGKLLLINGQLATYDGGETMTAQEPEHARILSETLGERRHDIQWEAGFGAKDWFGPVTIPADQFLMLGDNRDHSADSRYFGLVPRDHLIGRAERVLVSADLDAWTPRFERFGQSLRPRAGKP
jgi:signal peptidase I